MSEFQVGDVVKAFGCRGIVVRVDIAKDPNPHSYYSVIVEYESGNGESFMSDGRKSHWHKVPSLVLISRPKRKVTKTLRGFVNVYNRSIGCEFHETKVAAEDGYLDYAADPHADERRIACVEVTGTYEVEEES